MSDSSVHHDGSKGPEGDFAALLNCSNIQRELTQASSCCAEQMRAFVECAKEMLIRNATDVREKPEAADKLGFVWPAANHDAVLEYYIKNGNLAYVDYILKHSDPVTLFAINNDKATYIQAAMENGRVEIIKRLSRFGWPLSRAPEMGYYIAVSGHADMMEYF